MVTQNILGLRIRGMLLEILILLGLVYNPTRNRTPTCMYGGFGGDYINKGIDSMGIN